MKLILPLLLTTFLNAEVLLLTFHYNRPEFIEYQHKCYQKFLKDDYRLIVFNDAKDPSIEKEIRNTCERLGIECVRFEQKWHFTHPLNEEFKKNFGSQKLNLSHLLPPRCKDISKIASQPSLRHSRVIQYALDHYGYQHNDLVALVDGDLFPYCKFSIRSR